jgi:cytosine permease
VDFGTNARDKNDVSMGGLVGIALAILLTAGLSMLIVAGTYGSSDLKAKAAETRAEVVKEDVEKAKKAAEDAKCPLTEDQVKKVTVDAEKAVASGMLQSTSLIRAILGKQMAGILLFLLAVAAFPPACFSSFIAANSFKTTLPNVNPFISVGIGAAVSIALAVTGYAGQVIPVFVIIGASFGPICGAMLVDYVLSAGTWTGPRAGFNPAGWIAWALGFVVGILPNLGVPVPAAPVAAFIVGAVIYFLCAKAGLQSAVVPLPAAAPAAGGGGKAG